MDLVGGREVQELLGVSKQRANVITQREDFPTPDIVNGRHKVWERAAVLAWISAHRYDVHEAPSS